jgi:citrate synthase
MRGMPGLLYETSKLDAKRGISYRDHDLYEILIKSPTIKRGGQPAPEAILWLLLTGEFPNET